MPVNAHVQKIIKAAKLALARKKAQSVRSTNPIPPTAEMLTPSEIEQLLQHEQAAVAQLVDDAVELLGNATRGTEKAALRQRAQKLSLAARITARLLTRLRLDSKYPPSKQPSR